MDKVLYNNALHLGASDFGKSTRVHKRYYVVYNEKIIHFGSATGQTYIDHKDDKKMKAWKARHSEIINKNNIPFYKIKESPEYWSWHLLW